MADYRLLSTSGLLGYGFPEESLQAGMQRQPHMIGVDGGSTDPGPYYLGAGKCLNSRVAMKRDLRLMLRAALEAGIPLVVGSAGGAGSDPQLAEVVDIVEEIAREEALHFKLAVIHAEQDKTWVRQRLEQGRVRPLRNVAALEADAVERATRIVGMMGPEPFMAALDDGAQVILAGRSSDPAPWAGCAMRGGAPPGPAWYAGKMLECGATAAWPKGHDCLLVTADAEGIVCEATNPIRKCTPMSVANHNLHENPSPNIHQEPGGVLDTSECTYEAVSERAVRVSGMRWTPDERYTVKLEGAELVGYRALTICGTRDPGLIAQFDSYLGAVRENVAMKAEAFGVAPEQYRLSFRVYGQRGVMGEREPVEHTASHELGVLVDVVADTQDIASAVLAIARTNTLHVDFPGRLCKEGNMAFPFSPSDVPCGPVYRFNVFHVVEPDHPLQMFRTDFQTL